MDLRKVGALSPNAAFLADDRCGSEIVTFSFAHQVLIHVLLPRHLSANDLALRRFGFIDDFLSSASAIEEEGGERIDENERRSALAIVKLVVLPLAIVTAQFSPYNLRGVILIVDSYRYDCDSAFSNIQLFV